MLEENEKTINVSFTDNYDRIGSLNAPYPANYRYRMIESITIENFRCYEHVSIRDLKTVNVIVGRNGSGKTAFLEALFFASGGPTLAFRLRGWRGLPATFQVTDYTQSKNNLWRDIFHKFDQERTMRITFRGTEDVDRRVEVQRSGHGSQFVAKGDEGIGEIPALEFRYFRGKHKLPTVRPIFSSNGMELPNSPEPIVGHFYPTALQVDPLEMARNFSKLSKRGETKLLVEAVREVFPEIVDLSLELEGDTPAIFATTDASSEKLPIGLVSSGAARLLQYLTAVASQERGIVMIDEIENGFYFDRMADVWKCLHRFCNKNGVQLFVSTHSAECLRAMESAIEESPGDFVLLRAVRQEGKSTIRCFEGSDFLAALEEHVELR